MYLRNILLLPATWQASDKSINAKSNFGNECKNVTSSVESLSLHSALKYEKELLKIIAYILTFGTTRWWNIFLKFFCDNLVVACYFKKKKLILIKFIDILSF